MVAASAAAFLTGVKSMLLIEVKDNPLTLAEGCVSLDADQLRRRKHNLVKVDENLHQIKNPIMFKVGETFGYVGEGLPKHYAIEAEELEPTTDLVVDDSPAELPVNAKSEDQAIADILNHNVSEVIEILAADFNEEDLLKLKAAEEAGKNRTGVLTAIEGRL